MLGKNNQPFWKNIHSENKTLTVKEIRFQVNVKDVSAQTLNGVIKKKNVHSLAILYVKALVYVNKVSELHLQVVSGYFVHQNAVFLYVIRTQENKNGVVPFF